MRQWVAKTLLGRLAAELLQLLSPVGAVFAALEKTYTTIVFFLEKAHRIQAVLTTIVDSLLPIALGQTGPAAAKVEAVLAGLVPLALGFVADFIGLGGLTGAVRGQLERVRAIVDKLVERLLDKVMKLAAKLVSKGQQVAGQVTGAVKGFLGVHKSFKTADGASHELYFRMVNGEPQLVRASNLPVEIRQFLEGLPQDVKSRTHYGQAMKRVDEIELHTRTARMPDHRKLEAAKNTTAKQEKEMAPHLEFLSQFLYDLLPTSELPTSPEMEKKSKFTYKNFPYRGGSDGQAAQAEYLSSHSAVNGNGTPESTNDEMRYAQGVAGQNAWVRMHLISAALGGQGNIENWVAAPTEVNTSGAVRVSFEEAAERLVRTAAMPNANREPAPGPKHVMLWVDVRVLSYHTHAPTAEEQAAYGLTQDKLYFPAQMSFTHGLYLPSREGWQKLDAALSRQLVRLSFPRKTQVDLNQTSRTRMSRSGVTLLQDDGITRNADLLRTYIKEEAKLEPFSSIDGPEKTSLQTRILKRVQGSTTPTLKKALGGPKELVDELVAQLLASPAILKQFSGPIPTSPTS